MKLKYLPPRSSDFLRAESYFQKDIFYSATTFLPFSKNCNVQNIARRALREQVVPYYAKRGLEANTAVYNLLVEPLKNANFHGTNKDSVILFELFLTPLVLLAGFNDEGDYFKRPEVKKAWENRILFPEKHRTDNREIGFGVGTELIYNLADLIEVDNPTGTLYTGWMAKHFCS